MLSVAYQSFTFLLNLSKKLLPSKEKMTFLVFLEKSTLLNFLSDVPPEMYAGTNTWLIMSEDAILGDIFFPIDSQVFTFKKEEIVKIREVYKIDESMEQTVKEFGTWIDNELVFDNLPIFERRKDFEGYRFHGETMVEPPYIYGDNEDLISGKQTVLGGIWGDVWHALEKTMNFSTKIVPGDGWGSLNEDGTWNGIINGLIQNRTQIGIASFFYTQSRGTVAAFSPAICEGTDRMFIKYPGREASWTTYIDPFDGSLWISVFFLMSFIICLLSATYYLGPERKENPDSFTLSNTAIVVLGSQIFQGSWLDPKCISSKMIFFISFLFGVTLYASYSAKLISFLTVIKTTLPFNTLDEIRRTDFGIGSIQGSAVLDKFLYAPEGSTHLKVAEEIVKQDPSNMPASFDEAMEKTKAGKYAFVWTVEVVYDLNKDNCDLLDIPFAVNTGQLAFAWPNHLPHRHYFDHFINKMKETGQMDRILTKWMPKPRSDCGANGEFVSMGLDNMISAFAMVAGGCITAIFVLIIEICKRFKHFKTQDNAIIRRPEDKKQTETADYYKDVSKNL